MLLPPGLEARHIHDAERDLGRDRRVSHVLALRDHAAVTPGLRHRILSRLSALRPATVVRPAVVGPAAMSLEAEHELTDYVCRLADGVMGRVAIRQVGGEWTAVCVAAP